MDFFHRNKILLTDDIIEQIGVINYKMNFIKNRCREELNSLSNVEENIGINNPEIIYGDPEHEVEVIKERITTLKENQDIKTIEKEIKKLRKLTEEYFKKLTI